MTTIRPEVTRRSDAAADEPTFDWVELQRIVDLKKASSLSGLSVDSIKRHHSDKIIELSPRRRGMRVRDALMIEKHKKMAESAFAGSAMSDSKDQPRVTSRNTAPTSTQRRGRRARASK